jgi:hypothetical protein
MTEAMDPISVRARFERFPATVKGAFIFRGEDPDPHQVVLDRARVVAVGPGASAEVPIAPVTLDVIPHRDLFVPFELSVSELDPGWYTLLCDVQIDGAPDSYDGGRRFCVPWPRATVRRGTVKVERDVVLADATVRVEQFDCAGDSVKVLLRVDPPGPVSVRLFADGRRLEILESEIDEVTGRGRVLAYPVLRTDATVRVEIKGKGRGPEAALEVSLGD